MARRSPRQGMRSGALGALLAASGAHGAGDDFHQVRRWDELRVSGVSPSRIFALGGAQPADAGFPSAVQTYLFGRDWLSIQGVSNDANFLSSLFEFQRLDYPHEWSAGLAAMTPVTLRVGKTCNCPLAGVAAYTKSDASAWLRLQFEDCEGCESTASRAAVLVPVMPSEEHDSNLYQWMCSISDHAACHGLELEVPDETSLTQGTAPAAAAAAASKNATKKPSCDFVGAVGVRTEEQRLGPGSCRAEPGGKISTRKAASMRGCQMACDLTYSAQAANYLDLADINAHLEEINGQPEVCTGYAFNAHSKTCRIYLGAATTGETDGLTDWVCFAHVRAKSFVQTTDFDADCATAKITATTTSTPSTTSTSTSTKAMQQLSLRDLFELQPENGQVYGDVTDGEAHFPRQGLEATLLQFQSHCFQDVDYYLLDRALPVSNLRWASVLSLLQQFGDPAAWNDPHVEDCSASISVQRLPVQADLGGRAGSASLPWAARWLLSLLLPLALGAVGAALALLAKGSLFVGARGVAVAYGEEGEDCCAGFRFTLAALCAATVAVAAAFCAGQFSSWMMQRIAVKQLAAGGAPNLLAAAPLLSDLCLPTAVAVGCATLVLWLWPMRPARMEHQAGRSIL